MHCVARHEILGLIGQTEACPSRLLHVSNDRSLIFELIGLKRHQDSGYTPLLESDMHVQSRSGTCDTRLLRAEVLIDVTGLISLETSTPEF